MAKRSANRERAVSLAPSSPGATGSPPGSIEASARPGSTSIAQPHASAPQGADVSAPKEIAAVPDRRISREEVTMAWRLLLGREPESDQVIESHRLETLEELRIVLMKSSEFALKYQMIAGRKPDDPH